MDRSGYQSTLNHSLLLRCMYRARNVSYNVNDPIINAFIHASSLNFSAKVIKGDFNYPEINWNSGISQSCNDKFPLTFNMYCWSQ